MRGEVRLESVLEMLLGLESSAVIPSLILFDLREAVEVLDAKDSWLPLPPFLK